MTIHSSVDIHYKNLVARKDHFAEDSQYGTEESKRLGLPKTQSTLFGVEGSFRSINID
jgi:hypothetical protein